VRAGRTAAQAVAVALLLAAAPPAASVFAQEVAEEPTAFPEGEHRDDVFYFCTACHSSRLVSNQAMSRERWDDTLTWMTERHGMPPLAGEERERVLDYLTAAFGPAAGGAAPRSPFLTAPERKNPFAPK
jgi:hypothetical protein